jgi:hypothetical protein
MSRRLTKQLNMVVAVTNELARLNKLAVEVDGWHHVTRRGARGVVASQLQWKATVQMARRGPLRTP